MFALVFKYSKGLNSSIQHIDWTLTGTNTPDQSEPGSNGNGGVLHNPQSSRTRASPSDCLVSSPGQLVVGGESYPFTEVQLGYS